MRYYNAIGETTPDEGLEPDYYISDGYAVNMKDIGDVNEMMLNYALSIISPNMFKGIYASRSTLYISDNFLTPIGEPSYVTEFKNKQYNESN